MKRYKRIALTILLTCITLVTKAQPGTSVAEAINLELGDNTCTFAQGEDYNSARYFVYTATERGLLKVEGTSTSASFLSVDAEGNETSCVKSSGSCLIPVLAGAQVFVSVSPNYMFEEATPVNFFVSFEANDNAGRGLSQDDPIQMQEGKTNITVNTIAGFAEYTSYLTFTASETGALNLSLSGYVLTGLYGDSFSSLTGSFMANYDNGMYVASLPVSKGKTVCISLTAYNPMTITATMSHPEKGSSPSYPIDLVAGDNEVSAEYGEFWYQFTCGDEAGYVTITSEQEIPRGHVSVHPINDIYTTLAQSETGYYDLRFKVNAHTSYLICIYKTEESEDWPNPDKISVSFAPFQQGETPSNPIVLSSNVGEKLSELNGTYYYAIKVPEGAAQMVEVTATGEAAEGCELTLYDTSEGQYYGAVGRGYVKRLAEAGRTLMLILDKQKIGSAVLTPVVRDIKAGEAISKPVPAQLGSNVLSKATDAYYTFTATLTGRISIKLDIPGVNVEFPVSANVNDGVYLGVSGVGMTLLDVEKGKTYYIHFSHISEDCTFVLAENEYQAGDTKQLAFEASGSSVTLDSGAMNVWYRYVAEKDGKMMLTSDIPGDVNTYIYYSIGDEAYPSSINNHDGEAGNIIYGATFAVAKGDVIYVHLVSNADCGGYGIYFNLKDFVVGESASKPFELIPGGSIIEVPAATRTLNQWIRVPLNGISKVRISTSRFVNGGVYTSTDFSHGYDFTFTADENNEVHTVIYESLQPVEALYVCLTQSFGQIEIKADILGPVIDGVEELVAPSAKAVYNLNGVRQPSLQRGVNIVRKADGRVVKVLSK